MKSADTIINASAFWQFSVDYYTYNRNKEYLLWLQDEAELNVNILLLMLFLCYHKQTPTASQISSLLASNKDLDSLTSHVRQARKQAKALSLDQSNDESNDGQSEYKALLDVELDLERRQQQKLISTWQSFRVSSHSQTGHLLQDFTQNVMRMIETDVKTTAQAKAYLKRLFENLLVFIDEENKRIG